MRKIKNLEKSKVFQLANRLRKALNWNLSESLKHAWKVCKLKWQLLEESVHFKFKKIDGSVREAFGTLHNINFLMLKATRNYSYDSDLQIRYYDLEKRAFRSFKVENLI